MSTLPNDVERKPSANHSRQIPFPLRPLRLCAFAFPILSTFCKLLNSLRRLTKPPAALSLMKQAKGGMPCRIC